jgi:hypothetical protein
MAAAGGQSVRPRPIDGALIVDVDRHPLTEVRKPYRP